MIVFRRGALISVVVAGLLMGGMAAGTAAASAATPPANLNGENLTVFGPTFTPSPSGDFTSARCNPTGTSTLSATVSGGASGPYPGTFTETFTAQIGPQTQLGNPLYYQEEPIPVGTTVAFHADFTITSGTTTIIGSKNLQANVDPTLQSSLGVCEHLAANVIAIFDGSVIHADTQDIQFNGLVNYNATIHTANGSFADLGTGQVGDLQYAYNSLDGSGGSGTSVLFFEDLYSTNTPVPLGPDTVTLAPVAGTNTVGTVHTVTASATSLGAPSAGAIILFKVTGSVARTGSCTTDSTGRCSFTYQGPTAPGTDAITGCADNNANGVADNGEPCGTATEAWVYPEASSSDQCKKGGWQYLVDDQGRPFKNQGDCVSFVSTGGKNKAAG